MTSEGTEMLISAFISKTGQSVAHIRHKIFQNRFFFQVKDTLRHFIGLISESGLKDSRDIIKQRDFFCIF